MCSSLEATSKEQTDALIKSQSDLLEKLGDKITEKLTPLPVPSALPSHQTLGPTIPPSSPIVGDLSAGSAQLLQRPPSPLSASFNSASVLLVIPYPIGHFVGYASSGLTTDDPGRNLLHPTIGCAEVGIFDKPISTNPAVTGAIGRDYTHYFWEHILAAPVNILQVIKHGYKLPFKNGPPLS
ncbi:hypothetical protein TCAL_15546 [Tigriopus californicus]|uniref:Uncharacterized protein n=1 Tax=Tigriopus californicus TaxID=6832 RepID=A0A553PTA2_TIGCA|nr:hypothetical protein TCAL_15546 [Tigriopus californicus]